MPSLDFDTLLRRAADQGASDLHMRVGQPPYVRVLNDLRPLSDYEPVTETAMEELMGTLLTEPERVEMFRKRMSVDFSHFVEGAGRFRVAYFQERNGWGCVFRQIPEKIPQLHEIAAPYALLNLTKLKQGLVLLTGPTGSGKSTTLAAMLDVINRRRSDHVLTIEDPIEFVHTPNKAVWTQREVGIHTTSFAQALIDGLREDPDVILVGEMRDLETIRTAITAADTGHLVFSTLHTSSAPDTINRIIGVFPDGEQQQIRTQLSQSLAAIICQTLIPTADGLGRVAAHEVLLADTSIRASIRDNRMEAVRSTLQTQGEKGMQTVDRAIVDLVRRGIIDEEEGRERAQNTNEFQDLLVHIRRGMEVHVPPKVTASDLGSFVSGDPLARVPRPQAPAGQGSTAQASLSPLDMSDEAPAPPPLPSPSAAVTARQSAPPMPPGVAAANPAGTAPAQAPSAPSGPVSMTDPDDDPDAVFVPPAFRKQ